MKMAKMAKAGIRLIAWWALIIGCAWFAYKNSDLRARLDLLEKATAKKADHGGTWGIVATWQGWPQQFEDGGWSQPPGMLTFDARWADVKGCRTRPRHRVRWVLYEHSLETSFCDGSPL